MKYLKIFEAFESIKLNKTLNFLSKDSRKLLIKDIEEICRKLDLPYSKISDDFIEYLPYKSAIAKFVSVDDKPCVVTNVKAFGDNGIKDKSCKGGKQERKWGKGVRMVDCPICKGTGIEDRANTLKLIKYWFDKDGNYIDKTGVSGVIKEYKEMGDLIIDNNWSTDLNDYDKVKRINITHGDLSATPTGSPVLLKKRGSNEEIVGVYIKEGYYVLSNNNNFNYQRPTTWATLSKRYGVKCSFYVGSASELTLLKPLKIDSGNKFNFSMSSGINLTPSLVSTKKLTNANFALILDVDKLKELKHESLKDIINKRKESRKDASIFIKNDDVKKMNIDRYISKLSEMPSDISKCKNVVLRVLGGDMIFLLIKRGYFNNLDNVISAYTTILSYIDKDGNITDQSKFDSYSNHLKDMVKSYNNSTKNDKLIAKDSMDKFEKEETNELSLQILKRMKSISKLLFEKIKSMDIENIDDLEVLLQKLYTMRNIIGGNRSNIYSIYNGVLNYIANNYNNFRTTLNDPQYNGGENTLQYFDRLENIIEKMF